MQARRQQICCWFTKQGDFGLKSTTMSRWLVHQGRAEPIDTSDPRNKFSLIVGACLVISSFIYVICIQEYFGQMSWPCSQYYDSPSNMCSLTQRSRSASAGGPSRCCKSALFFFLFFSFLPWLVMTPPPTAVLKRWGAIKQLDFSVSEWALPDTADDIIKVDSLRWRRARVLDAVWLTFSSTLCHVWAIKISQR